jgi:hypothetical protein
MAAFRYTDRIQHPLAQCYLAMRDRMAEFVPYLDGVREIRVLERREMAPGKHWILNEWISSYEVPAVLRPFLRPEWLRWLDKVVWDDERRAWQWEFDSPVLANVVRCAGENSMRELGPAETELVIAGDLNIHVENLPGVPAFVGRRMRPQVERFVLGLVAPRLRGIDEGLARYLDSRREPPPT